jgi:hypothetical protein
MDQATYDELQRSIQDEGPARAIDRLCQALRERKDYSSLFYALLMKKRYELGVSPVPTGPSSDLPEDLHGAYEDAIREAGRLAGKLYLNEGNIPHAWVFYRMLGETEPVRAALETAQAGDGEDTHQLIDIAYHQGVHPRRGFDLILDRLGICSAITMLGGAGGDFPHGPEVRDYCVKRLVRALYGELRERVAAEVERHDGQRPAAETVRELIEGRDWLFEDDYYHIDVSHLSSVVQMAACLPPCPELELARELCAYGQRLSPRFQYASEPPFEDQYRDYGVYLGVLAGDNVEEGLEHFRAKLANLDPEEVGTYPAEVYVNLLLRAGRAEEALTVARRYLAKVDDRRLTCPGVVELCQQTQDYRALAEVARELDNPVHFVAGLIAARDAAVTG